MSLATVVALAAALAACDDGPQQGSQPEARGSIGPAPDSHAVSRTFAVPPDAALPSPPETDGLTFGVPQQAIARSAKVDADVSVGDFGCFTDPSPAPDPATAVDCAESHATEQYGVLGMDEFWPADYEAYDAGTQTGNVWRAWASSNCDALLQQVNDLDELAETLGLTEATVRASGFVANGFALPTRTEWNDGMHRTYCTVRATADHEAAGLWAPTLVSADMPDALTVCKGFADGETTVVPCSEQHWREEAFYVNAADLFDQSFLDSVDPQNVTDDQWATLDEVCARSEELVVGAQRDDVKLYSDVVAGYWGDEPGWYPLNCGIVPEDSAMDLVGSAVGVGDGELQQVPTAVPAE